MIRTDVAIVGGGIVGLATAWQLTRRRPDLDVVVLEKENALARHQSSHNSGVLHAGIYYRPGSLKAQNCRAGKEAMQAFCAEEGIPFERCGKVIVAVDDSELPALEMIYERGRANGVNCALITRERLKELEPHAAGVRAIHVPETGIVDFVLVCDRLAQRIRERGAQIRTGARLTGVRTGGDGMVLETEAGAVETLFVVNCAGLYSDKVTEMTGLRPEAKIIPFRGEYYALKPEARDLVGGLIYPVPDPAFPFLGVHFTRMIHGGVTCGPNAVLAFSREGYRKRDIRPAELFESLTYSGLLRVIPRYWRTGLKEIWRSFSKPAFVRALKRLLPAIETGHLEAAPAGVRAQAIRPDGRMVDDFLIQESERVINVCNAPSPAATAALNIGRLIVERLQERF